MKNNYLQLGIAGVALMALLGFGLAHHGHTPVHAQETPATARVDRGQFEIRPSGTDFTVHAVIHNPRSVAANELFQVAIRSMAGQERGSVSQRVRL